MKFLLDVNIDATRVEMLRRFGVDAIHWSSIGRTVDVDDVIVRWVRTHRHVLVTQDKGIATELIRSGADSPSMILVRHAIDLGPGLMLRIAGVARDHEADLERGAVVVLDARTLRVRVHPIPHTPRS